MGCEWLKSDFIKKREKRPAMKCLIVIPAYNEAENIEKVVDNIIQNYGSSGVGAVLAHHSPKRAL